LRFSLKIYSALKLGFIASLFALNSACKASILALHSSLMASF